MILFFTIESLIFLGFGLLLIFRNSLIKRLLNRIRERNLFFIPGVIEIVMGLLTLHFRHETRLLAFVFIVGMMLFVDGIFYLVLSEKLHSTIDWLLDLESKNYRRYGVFIIMISVGLFMAAVIRV